MPENAKPGSLQNVAFDAGRLYERQSIIKALTDSDDHLIVFDVGIKKKQNRLIHSPKCGLCKSLAVIKGKE